MEVLVRDKELLVNGRFLKVAKLRHEWFEFVDHPLEMIDTLKNEKRWADVFTFVSDIGDQQPKYPFLHETDSVAILRPGTFEEWWRALDFKVRNKIRKAEKSGVELRPAELDDTFARGVEAIYNESPIRQGMQFWHYGKDAATIKKDLSSFSHCTFLVGAYIQDELIGFMKLFEGNDILRTVHIIAKLSQRDKPVQDALIAKAVQICDQKGIRQLQYGSWSDGGLGAFKIKHGFERVDVPRYFVPLTLRGHCMLKLNLHHSLRDQLPPKWRGKLVSLRSRLNSMRHNSKTGLLVNRPDPANSQKPL